MQDIKTIIVRNELKAYVMEKRAEQRELEERYNHYHDPRNGRFASGKGGGMGLYYSMGKGKGEIVGAHSRYVNVGEIDEMGKAYGMPSVSGRTKGYLQGALNGSEPLWKLEGYKDKLKREKAKDKRQVEKYGKSKFSDQLAEYKNAELKLVSDILKKLSSGHG